MIRDYIWRWCIIVNSGRYSTLLGTQDTEATMLVNRLQLCPELYGHGSRVANFAIEIAREMGLSLQSQEQIKIGGIFHDIGKLYIPNNILESKQLTLQEWDILKTHSQLGREAMEQSEYLSQFGTWVLYHHERFDGSGYPEGLAREQIPLAARIIAVADSLDAMISYRPYRDQSFSIIEAVYELRSLSGIQYDPNVIEVLDYISQRNFLSLLMCLL